MTVYDAIKKRIKEFFGLDVQAELETEYGTFAYYVLSPTQKVVAIILCKMHGRKTTMLGLSEHMSPLRRIVDAMQSCPYCNNATDTDASAVNGIKAIDAGCEFCGGKS